MVDKKKDEVAVMGREQVPDFMRSDTGGLGTEGLSQNALSPPRLKLAQAISPEIDIIPDLKAGEYFNSVTEAVYGSKVRIISCFMTESYLLFEPRVPGNNGGLIARANDGIHWDPPNGVFEVVIDKKGTKVTWKTADTVSKSGLAAWGSFDPSDKKSGPAAVHSLNSIILLPDQLDDGPMAMSFVRSGLKIGKKFAGNLKMSRAPSFGRIFELTSLKVAGPSGDYYEPRVKAAGLVTSEDLYKESRAIYLMAKERGVEVNLDDSERTNEDHTSAGANDKY